MNNNNTNTPTQPQLQPQQQPQTQTQLSNPPEQKMTINDKKLTFQNYYNKVNPFIFSKDLMEIAPQIETLEKLLEYEVKIDKILSKKKVDIQEQLLRPFPKIKRILRVRIYNTYHNVSEENAGWVLRIEGKLLNNEKNVYFFWNII